MTYQPTDNGECRYPREPEDPVMVGFDVQTSRQPRGQMAKVTISSVTLGDPCQDCRAIGFHFGWCKVTK